MYSKVDISTHCFIPKSELRTSLEVARKRLTATSSFAEGEFPMYRELPKAFGVPLYWYRNLQAIAKKVVDLRTEGSKIGFEFTSDLRPGQEKVIRKFRDKVDADYTGFTLEAPPGFGKTVVLIKMLSLLRRSAIIIVPRSNLVDQWVERIQDHSNYPKSKIGVINGKTTKYKGCPIVVALVHSIAAQFAEPQAFHQMFGVAVFDEVDRSVPPSTFSPVLSLFPVKYRIGASATVKRKDGLHIILDSHISQCRLKGGDEGRMKPKILIAEYPGDSGHLWKGSKRLNRRGMLITKLAKNPLRNQFITKFVRLIHRSGRRVVVLSDRTYQLSEIYWMLSRKGVPLEDMGYYCDTLKSLKGSQRKVKDDELKHTASACKIILATYGKFAIGTDIQDLAGLVYATPQSEAEQTQGRIERMMEGKSQPVVVDIVDTIYKEAEGWAYQRKKYYWSKRLKVKVI